MNFRDVWQRYVESWRVASEAEKRRAFAECLAETCVYRDPLMEARGWDELVAYMLEFHRQIPGGHFVTTEFWTHHGESLAKWEMRDGEGNARGVGVSHGVYDEKGKLRAMSGFFDVPEQPAA